MSIVRSFLFLFRRGSERARMRAIILHRASAWAAVLVPLFLGLVFQAGCASRELAGSKQPVPGSSFQRQCRELGDSFQMTLSMEDSQRSLEDDLKSISDVTPLAETRWDLKHMVTSPDAQRSIEDDLSDLGAREPGAFWETIQLLGW